jgi:BirA family biotin operon repressor/biotin-[acetyl-CoA-carboxylase] ligase
MKLDPSAASAGVGLVTHDTLGSTSAEALRIARTGGRGPLWIVAHEQTDGRGRRGRTWVSEPGNLYATLLLSDPAPPDRIAGLSFVAALAVHDAIAGRVNGVAERLTLKWPNDVLIDGHKVSGILIEGEGAAVAVGIGINCARHPQATTFPATDLATAGIRLSPEAVFAALSAAMLRRLGQWQRGDGFDAVRAEWLKRARGVGRPLRVAMPDGERSGRFETVDEFGRLVLRTEDGNLEIVTAGDVTVQGGRAAAVSRP